MVLRGGGGGVEELRRLLARAAADDDARSAALDALCERSVFAATVGAGDALRTLTNKGGQKAMPLFSGQDALEAAARQFKWASKAGAPALRELSAREAMQSALAQGVEFVVFDVGAPHCVEFARDEVALMLAAKQARQRPAASPVKPRASTARSASTRPVKPPSQAGKQNAAPASSPRKTGPPRRPNTTPAAMPAARARTSTPAGAQRKRAPTPVPPAPARAGDVAADRARRPTPPPLPAAAAPSAAPKPPRPPTPPPMPAARVSFPAAEAARSAAPPAAERTRLETPAARPAVRVSVPAAARTSPGFALDPGTHVRVSMPSPALGPAASDAPSSSARGNVPRVAMPPPMELPSADAADALLSPTALPTAGTAPGAAKAGPPVELPRAADSLAPLPSAGAGVSGAPDSFAPRVPRAKPTGGGGPRPPSLSVPVEPLPAQVDTVTGLGFAQADALPEIRANAARSEALPEAKPSTAHAVPAAGAAPAAPSREHATTTEQEISPPQVASEKATLKQMAMKGMDDVAGRSLKTAAKAFAAMLGNDGDKRVAGASKPEPAGEETAQDAAERGDELPEEPGYAEGALRPLHLGLSDAVQGAIADALRAYPEVEWACEVSDGSDVPVVGVRVSLSFTNRVDEIEATLLKAASARNASVRVLMLNEPALMREARAHGNTFFPWRKRPARK